MVNIKIQKHTGESLNMQLDENSTGNMLKQRVQLIYGKMVDEQTLWFQNQSAEDLGLVEDLKTLKTQGICDGAVIQEGKDVGRKNMDGELRQNIERNKANSYYYAHANETPLPDDVRFVEGGDPIKLGEQAQQSASPEDSSPLRKWPTKAISAFSWAQSDEKVTLYVTQPECVKAANEKKENVEVTYEKEGFALSITTPSPAGGDRKIMFKREWRPLTHEIVPEKCKAWKVGEKKLTFYLRKKVEQNWFSLTQD